MTQNNRITGSYYETQVAAFLEAQGMTILDKNFRCRMGEIDLIARDGRYLVFIEVKFRSSGSAGYSLEAIDRRKIGRIRKAASFYLYSHRLPEETPCRFDAAGVDGQAITYIKDVF